MLPLLLIPIILLIYMLYRWCEYHPMITGGGKKKYSLYYEPISKITPPSDTSQLYWRGLEMSQTMHKKYPQWFAQIESFRLLTDCKDKVPKWNRYITKLSEEMYNEMRDTGNCLEIKYEPYLSNIRAIWYDNDKFTFKERFNAVKQLLYIIYLLLDNGYGYREFQPWKIAVFKTSDKFVKIFGYDVPTNGYRYKLLYSGEVLHNKFILDDNEKNYMDWKNHPHHKNRDVHALISWCMDRRPMFDYYDKHAPKGTVSEGRTKIITSWMERLRTDGAIELAEMMKRYPGIDEDTQIALSEILYPKLFSKMIKPFDPWKEFEFKHLIPKSTLIIMALHMESPKKILEIVSRSMQNVPYLNAILKKDNIKIIKELASGGNGTAYLVIIDNKKYVCKVERMDVYDKKQPLQSEYYRLLKFNEDIAVHHPNKFLTIITHGIIKDCKYVHPATPMFEYGYNQNADHLRRFKRKNSGVDCGYIVYTPYLKPIDPIFDCIMQSSEPFLDFMYQIIDGINIMRKKDYNTNDVRPGNIMYKKLKNKNQYYIIDYGNMSNPGFPISEFDRDMEKRLIDQGTPYKYDLLAFIEYTYRDAIKPSKDDRDPPDKQNIEIQLTKYPLLNKRLLRMLPYLEEHKSFHDNVFFSDVLIYCLKHYQDKNYDDILSYIKMLK